MDVSHFAIGGVLNQIQGDWEVVIAYASRSLRQSQRRYCTTRRAMLAAVTMCNHFGSYLRGAQFTLCTDHQSLRWLQKFCNSDGMLARWYMLPGQFSVTFEYGRGRNRLMLMAFPVSAVSACKWNLGVVETGSTSELAEQHSRRLRRGRCIRGAELLPAPGPNLGFSH